MDTYTYPNFISLANQLYLQLVPIENDREGMRPDLLESACALQNIKGVYMMPAGSNPTNIAWSDARKEEIGGIIRKMDLMGIEEDVYKRQGYDRHALQPASGLCQFPFRSGI